MKWYGWVAIGLVVWIAVSNGWINFGGRINPYEAAAAVQVRNPLPAVGVGDPRHPQVRFGSQQLFDGLLNAPEPRGRIVTADIQVPDFQAQIDAAIGSHHCSAEAIQWALARVPGGAIPTKIEQDCSITYLIH